MDSNNCRPPQADQPPPMDSGDWRTQFQPDSRQKIIEKIMYTLKRHIPFSGEEGEQELKKIAVRFEEKIYSSATSQTDYLRRISVKMLTMESKSQNTLPNVLPSNSMGGSRNPSDPAPSQNMQAQMHDPGQSVLVPMVPNQSQARQQLLAQNTQNDVTSIGVQGAADSLPPVSGLTPSPTPNVAQNPNLQNISGIQQSSMGNNMNQGVTSSLFANVQRQMQGRQLAQQIGMQQQPQQSQNQFIYHQQLQQQMLKQKIQQGNIQQLLQSSMQRPSPQQQNNLLQAAQLQSSQQQMMQTSSAVRPSMLSGMQQSQQSIAQPPPQSALQQHQQPVLGQQEQQPQQTAIVQQQQMMPSQLQQPLMGRQPNAVNIQQHLLIGQQNNISDMQQQQQHQRLLGQQNIIPKMPSQQPTNSENLQQQQLISQQSNISNMAHQNHVGLAQQQQLMGPQSGSTSMQSNHHSVPMMQQTNSPAQQQCQNASSLLTAGQQPQAQAQSQQRLMSQLQSQPAQLQQHLDMQQQPTSFQQNMQPRIQTQSPLLQQQNMIDQQQQLFQPQRAPPEAPSTSLDSTAQTSSASAGDWQEEVYQKIKVMKDLYYADLNEMYPKVSIKLQQLESLRQPPKAEQLEKLRQLKLMLEKLMQFLQTTKNNILPVHRDKLASVEKQILNLLNSHRPRKPMPPMQQGQIQLQSVQQSQQPHSPLPQGQSQDSRLKPWLQSINSQGAIATVQPSHVSNMQNGSMPSLSAIASSQQSTITSLQPSSKLDSVSRTTPNSMQQVAIASMQQTPVGAPQQANINPLQSRSGVNILQHNINALQSNSNMLQSEHLKQQQDQQMMQTHQLTQQLQNRHFQQQLQKQQLQKQQMLQQQLQLQAKQQQATQMNAHQMPQLHQLHDVNDLKMRQGLGVRSGAFPSHLSSVQRYSHQQLKPGASFPLSSPQLLPAVSPQISQHSSPQIDQQNVPPSVRTPLQSANSPFAPSPSTPMVPSPMPGDPEKPVVISLSNAANVGLQQTNIVPGAPQSLSVGTPGISPSPFLECGAPDGTHGNASTVPSGKSRVTEQPLERLLKAVKSMSPKALTASVSDIGSIVNMIDTNAGSAPGNGSRATVGEDLVAMTKCRLQARNFLTQDGTTGTKRVRCCTSAMPLNFAASAGSMNDSFKQLSGSETSELKSTATSSIKKARIEVNQRLLEEIGEINESLIDTYVDISDENVDLSVASTAVGSEGTVVRCCFSAISLGPSLKSMYNSAQMSSIQPFRMLVPSNYPDCSPILLDSLPVEVSGEHEDLSAKAKSRFIAALRSLSQPMSLKEIARTWDDCTRAVISDYAQQNSGGTFSSKYGAWENCLSTA